MTVVVTGELKNQVDRVWDAFWSGHLQSHGGDGADHLSAVLHRLSDEHDRIENLRRRFPNTAEKSPFPEGDDEQGRPYADLRWSRFKNLSDPAEMFAVVGDRVFPWLRTLGGNGSSINNHMKDARFTIPNAGLLAKVVDLLDQVPMEDRDTKGDIYEYMLGMVASAGKNGQFRTPRHIIKLMVEMTAPTAKLRPECRGREPLHLLGYPHASRQPMGLAQDNQRCAR